MKKPLAGLKKPLLKTPVTSLTEIPVAKQTNKIFEDDLKSLREEVELLELRVRRFQARELLKKYRASRKTKTAADTEE